MAFDFPASPTVGQQFSPAGGPTWQWDGTVWSAVPGLAVGATAQSYNRIVNGAMQHSQEMGNTGSAAGGTLAYYAADQWFAQSSTSPGTAAAVRAQSVTSNGSLNRFRVQVFTAEPAMAVNDYLHILQHIEGSRIADFQWGTAAAKQVVLRFGFKAPAGTYSIVLRNNAFNRGYLANFTIAAGQANTDTVQTFAIPGDVTGTWVTDTGIGIRLSVTLAAGSGLVGTPGWSAVSALATSSNTNGMATTSNVFELFDVGLYLDPNTTGLPPPWVASDLASELLTCQRYWQKVGTYFTGNTTTAIGYHGIGSLPVQARAAPTVSGVNVQNTGFAATVGSFDYPTGASNMIREIRAANATANGSFFSTTVIVNARM